MNPSQETKNALLGMVPSPAAAAEILTGISNGIKYAAVVPSTAISNTVTETPFDTNYTIPANTLKVGSRIKIRFQGIAPATNATDTLLIKLYLATTSAAGAMVGTVLIPMTATDVANNDVFQGEYELVVRTIGSAGTIVGCGVYKNPSAEGTMTAKDDILASTAIDTTVAQIVVATATWSVANAGNSCRLDTMNIDIAL